MTPLEFARKWKPSTLTESAASQEHFIDICNMLDHPTPAGVDADGSFFTFERGASKTSGGDGWADVWKKGCFGWEYKGKHKDLEAAYDQLLQYREDLENPPLLVVCDMDRFQVHTNFTNTAKRVYEFTLDDLEKDPGEPLRILRAVLYEPESLKPGRSRTDVTEDVAGKFAELAELFHARGHDPLKVAHFLVRLLFCLFAEDTGLLPSVLLTRMIQGARTDPDRLTTQVGELFSKMVTGGFFGADKIEWFNGGLFEDAEVLPFRVDDVRILLQAALADWSSVEPSILGTLFERGLDPKRRSQLGAHYTDLQSILRVVDPVVVEPLTREFDATRVTALAFHEEANRLAAALEAEKRSRQVGATRDRKLEGELAKKDSATLAAITRTRTKAQATVASFLDRLREVKVLDPASGSGNFLYVVLRRLLDLEKKTVSLASQVGSPMEFPKISVANVHGIELDTYAAELARVTISIGYIQWRIENGYGFPRDPVLPKHETVEQRDAILTTAPNGEAVIAEWPDAEFVIGNPPFLGGGPRMRKALGDEYVDALNRAWEGRVPKRVDLVCYWHERAREQIQLGRTKRAGLLATQTIRSGPSQRVLAAIKASGDIFEAWRNEPWVIEGADVRVSIICQDDGTETQKRLDGKPASEIHANLGSGGTNVTERRQLPENEGVAFQAAIKVGPFDLSPQVAAELLAAGPNVNQRPNSDVVLPWSNTLLLLRQPWKRKYIIDFGVRSEEAAAGYEAPFAYVRKHVYPYRLENRDSAFREQWWIHGRPRPALRAALADLTRFILTPTTSRNRIFVWGQRPLWPDHKLNVIARGDDYAFGVLHSRIHEVWSLATVARQGVGNDPVYAPDFAFATFPFPWPLNLRLEELTHSQKNQADAIGQAAAELNETRRRWLYPPELMRWEEDLDPSWPKIPVPKYDDAASELKQRTLTKLYGKRPDWLRLVHQKLDAAVAAAYDWPVDLPDDEILARLLLLNQQRSK